MPNLRTRLPPVNSLVVFEAAGRSLSFTRAAEELLISREAVSRQIRILEGHLGVRLFARLHRALELTKAGRELHAVVAGSLEDIARSAGSLRGATRGAKVIVTATVAIASYWLTPRLPRFRAAQPGTEIRVVVADKAVDMASAGVDVGLRYGDGNWPGSHAVHLFDVDSFPVCSPDYLASHGAIAAPVDLAGHALLNLDGTTHAGEDWAWWLEAAGAKPRGPLNILGFDNYANVIQAALDGQGIALGFSGMIDGILAKGNLVRPLETANSKGRGVYLVVPKGAVLAPKAQAFFDWALAEAHG